MRESASIPASENLPPDNLPKRTISFLSINMKIYTCHIFDIAACVAFFWGPLAFAEQTGFLFPCDPNGGAVTMQSAWEAMNSVPWITLKNKSGGKGEPCSFSISSNDSGGNRYGTFYVGSTRVTITQCWCKAASNYGQNGEPENLRALGTCYDFGLGVEKNDSKAVEWYRKAAEQGDARGQCCLGFMYEYGEGVAKDLAKAVEWYRKAAEQGDARGQCNLGTMYYNGEGVAKDLAKAVAWFQKAAEQGDARGQCNLGFMYENGQGVEKDLGQAAEWYRKAAEQGNARGQCNLGIMYYNGEGVAKDLAKAAEWYRKAAEQGNEDAQERLCLSMCNCGESSAEALAVEWCCEAAKSGNEIAKRHLESDDLKGFYLGMNGDRANQLSDFYGIQCPWKSKNRLVFMKADLTKLFHFGVDSYEKWASCLHKRFDYRQKNPTMRYKEQATGVISGQYMTFTREYFLIPYKPGIKVTYYGKLTNSPAAGEEEYGWKDLKRFEKNENNRKLLEGNNSNFQYPPGTLVVETIETF